MQTPDISNKKLYILEYFKILNNTLDGGSNMALKQISLTMPEALFEASKHYCTAFGYRNIQEFIVDLMRKKVILENYERYKEIEERMNQGVKVKKFSQKDAVKYVKGL